MRNRQHMPPKTFALALGLAAMAATARGEITLIETVDVVPTSVVALPRSYYVPSSFVSSSSVFPTSYASVYDLTPTSYYVPTSYYTSTSYVVPTRYYVPTSSYIPTSYYAPASVYETSYTYRRGLFGRRRYAETTYLYEPTVVVRPTTYYAPTSYVARSVVVGSSLCCETSSPAVVSAPPIRENRPVAEPTPERQAGGAIESSAVGDQEDRIEPIVPATPPATRQRSAPSNTGALNGNTSNTPGNVGSPSTGTGPGGTTGAASPAAGASANPTPGARDSKIVPTVPGSTAGAPGATGGPAPAAGAADSTAKGATTPVPKPADPASPPVRTEPEPPPFPATLPSPAGTGDPLGFPSLEESGRRSAYKPVVPSIDNRARLVQNVLRGRVVSADSLQPESGVQVILVDRKNRFADRTTRTDSSGRFALALPEGDWTILLTMPSGRALPVEQGLVTASAGKVSDRWGRELSNLVLSR